MFSYLQVPRSGVRYSLMLEWALAARWWYMDIETFGELDGETQSYLIAAYRTHAQIEAVTAWYQTKKGNKRGR